MSNSSEHQTPIKTPKQLVGWVVAGFVVPIFVITLLVTWVNSSKKTGAGTSAQTVEAIADRIQPVARIELAAVQAGGGNKTGEEVYKAQCSACHATGAAGSPKYGDAGAWAPRIKEGYEHLLTSALKGKGAMGPQGGGAFSDVEVGRAVVFMANAAGAKFAEPKAPEAAKQ